MAELEQKSMCIAVMGVTGAGKSRFIQKAGGFQESMVGRGLNSYTATVEPYIFQHEGTEITLIDTPGFNDTKMDEGDVLRAIADWLDGQYRDPARRKLNGIIYLQSIQEPRIQGSALLNLRMFEKLCGEDPLKNVILVTTRWDLMAKSEQLDLAFDHEKELKEDEKFWRDMIEDGASVDRFMYTPQSAIEIIMRLQGKEALPLQIQVELVDEGRKLIETSAAQTVNAEMLAMEERYKTKIAEMETSIAEAQKDQRARLERALKQEREKTQRKVAQVKEQQSRLQYDSIARDRLLREELQDIRAEKEKLELLLEKIGAKYLDFDETVAKLEANSDKLRPEQRIAMQSEIDKAKKEPKKERTVWKLLLNLLPMVGSVALALVGIPIMPGALAGVFTSMFGNGGGNGC